MAADNAVVANAAVLKATKPVPPVATAIAIAPTALTAPLTTAPPTC